jgi:hypothetical protein
LAVASSSIVLNLAKVARSSRAASLAPLSS